MLDYLIEPDVQNAKYGQNMSDEEFLRDEMHRYWMEAIVLIESCLGMYKTCNRCVMDWSKKFAEAYFEEVTWAVKLFESIPIEEIHMLALTENVRHFETIYDKKMESNWGSSWIY